MKPIETIIFDVSGTLLDDLFATWLACREAFKYYGIAPPSLHEFQEEFFLPSSKYIASKGIDERIASIDFKDRLKIFATEFRDLVSPFPEAKSTLARLQEEGFRLAAVSQTPRMMISKHIESSELERYLEVTLYGEDCEEHKPSPKPLQMALESLRPIDGMVVYVGDMREDIIAARRAGMLSIAYSNKGSYHSREKLESSDPLYIVRNLSEILSVIHLHRRFIKYYVESIVSVIGY